MQTIFTSDYLVSSYIPEKKIILNVWQNVVITPEDFKFGIMEVAKKGINFDVVGVLVDCREFNLAISNELQEWHDKEIVPKYNDAGIKKIAMLLPQEFFAQLSIQLTMSEPQAKTHITKYFDDYTSAETWLIN